MMKKLIVLLYLVGIQCVAPVMACTVCRSQQPAPLRGITHGAGPSGIVDYFIIGSAVIVVVAVLILSIRYLVRPGELSPDHIKNVILKSES